MSFIYLYYLYIIRTLSPCIAILICYLIISNIAIKKGRKLYPIWGFNAVFLYYIVLLIIIISLFLFDFTEYAGKFLFGFPIETIIINTICVYIVIVTMKIILNYFHLKKKIDSDKRKLRVYCLIYFFIFFVSIFLSPFHSTKDPFIGEKLPPYGLFEILISLSFSLLGASICIRLYKQNKEIDIQNLLQKDKRKPVLLLRSFELDKIIKRMPFFSFNSLFRGHVNYYARAVGISFEEILSKYVNKYIGPFIAIGNPKDILPSLGAKKIYCKDDNWQSIVIKYFEISDYIIVFEGITPGLLWELKYLRNNVHPSKIFIFTFPKNYEKKVERRKKKLWAYLALQLNDMNYQVPFEDPGAGTILSFSIEWKAVILKQELKTIKDYVLCLKKINQ